MRAIPILTLLFSISTSSTVHIISTPQKHKDPPPKTFTLQPDAFLNKIVEHEATFLEKRKVMENIKRFIGVADDLSFATNLSSLIENNESYDSFKRLGGDTGERAMSNLLVAHIISKNKTNFLDFMDLILKGLVSKRHPSFSIWWFLHKTVERMEKGDSLEDVRLSYAHGHIEMEDWLWETLGLVLIPTTEAPSTEAIITSTDASTSTNAPKRGAGGAGQSSYPPIDPVVLASLNAAKGRFIQPNTLPDGTPLSDLPEEYAVYKGFDEFSRVVANKHGYFVLHPVQTKDNNVIFDPYTIGQVMGYIYEYEEFKGVRPQDGWTVEMIRGDKKIPTAVKRSSGGAKSRRVTLVFTKKSDFR